MNTLRHQAAGYLALRRALGFKLVDTERLLMQFITYLEQGGTMRITTDVAVAWARQTGRVEPLYWRRDWVWSAGSPAICTPWTQSTKYHRPGCCAASRTGCRRTCTPPTTSARWCARWVSCSASH